jgi:hypothetical protein
MTLALAYDEALALAYDEAKDVFFFGHTCLLGFKLRTSDPAFVSY